MSQTITQPAIQDSSKGYNPQLQGYQYNSNATTAQVPTIVRPTFSQTIAQPQKPLPVAASASQDWLTAPVQWNPAGVYGGIIEPRKGIPAWGWVLMALLLLVLMAAFLLLVV